MKTTATLVLGAAVLALSAIATQAQVRPPMGWNGPEWGGMGPDGNMRGAYAGRMLDRLIDRYDRNGDGALTQDEIDAARQEQHARFDTDGDGVLTLDEYQSLWSDAMRERMVDRFQSHDDDGDARVTVEEFGERVESLVDRFDRNGDGQLDHADLRRGSRMRE